MDPTVRPVTLSAKLETEADKVVLMSAAVALTGADSTVPEAAVICAEPVAIPLASPLPGEALLTVITDVSSEIQVTWPVMS